MSDFDFGFTMVDEDDLEIVQQVKSSAKSTASEVDKYKKKCDNLYNMVLPLLNNLAANPDKDYIKWDGKDRLAKIEQFRDKMDEVYTS
tara:strand:- start:3087 stop:3350 length:264 start_codon:yes stop_codon:yes gene_type:complete